MALRYLAECAQSYWLDEFSRAMIASGELEERIERENLRGVTSNPKIFKEAITGGSDYDLRIGELMLKHKDPKDIYEALAVEDVRAACDILGSVYENTRGYDGFVSLEVSPRLAYDVEGTVEEALRLHRAVHRPNLLIKIPGTLEGVRAFEEALFLGVNVNVTLLFSIERYAMVARRYQRALERRMKERKPIDNVVSVASFFLSRIDLLVDRLLEYRELPGGRRVNGVKAGDLYGRAATANARLAYQRLKEIHATDRWRALESQGARVQRLLWASTGVKNPSYRDTMYIEPLIGPHTITTMPPETAAAFADHGRAAPGTIEDGVAEARALFRDLKRIGIDMEAAAWQLLNEGVRKFVEPFDALIETIARKRDARRITNVSHQKW